MMKTLILTLALSSHLCDAAVFEHKAFLGNGMQPEVVARTLSHVEDEWKAQAAVFADCHNTAGLEGASIVNCNDAPGSFGKSCKTVVSAIIQGSGGDKAVTKEYMNDVCSQPAITGWHQVQCHALALTVHSSMSADKYENRIAFNTDKLCTGLWSRFLVDEKTRTDKDQATREAADKEAAKEAAESEKLLKEQLQKQAERKKVEEDAHQKQEAQVKEADAKANAAESAARLATKKAEAKASAQAAKVKMEEADAAERDQKAKAPKAEAKLATPVAPKPAAQKPVAAVAKPKPLAAKPVTKTQAKGVTVVVAQAKPAAEGKPVAAKAPAPKKF